jgi:hypothetical protein
VKVKSREKSDKTLHCWRGGERRLLEASQALTVRPSDKGSVKVKTLGWLEAVA